VHWVGMRARRRGGGADESGAKGAGVVVDACGGETFGLVPRGLGFGLETRAVPCLARFMSDSSVS
jgi:hypothetical protein